ncbi:hypothetical protein ACFVRD_25325 [Streptomyces sp. NPDC057908]|uniref:hypothetical protein n=1 Tax=Streptomyces sp. NPDC057908 TaxID=3346276 RepID=UPI0036EB8458
MDTEIAALAASGATTLMGLMVSDCWTSARNGFGRLFDRDGRTENRAENTLTALDTARNSLLRGRDTQDESVTHAVAAEWRDRLHTLLRADPSARAELRSLLDSLGEPPRNQASPAVHNVISGGVQHGQVIQTGRIDGSVLSPPHND